MRLNTTTRKLEAVLDAAGTDVIFFVESTDVGDTVNFRDRGLTTITASTGATKVTICPAPNQGVSRNIEHVTAYNGNAATRIVTIQIDDNGTTRIRYAISLLPTESAEWSLARGWQTVT